MKNRERILVGFDLSPMDELLLQYIKAFQQLIQADQVYFFHITPIIHIPEAIKEGHFASEIPQDETIKNQLVHKVDNIFSEEEKKNISIEVRDGNPDRDLLEWAHTKKIDLLVLGRKPDEENRGKLPEKIINIADCSLLIIPPVKSGKINKIHVGVDFSEKSMLALKTALSIAKAAHAEVVCHHVYHVPSGYHKTGKDYDEFAEVMKDNAKKEATEFLKKENIVADNLTFEYTLDKDNNPAKILYDFAKEKKADMIFIGSKGRTAAASLLLGNVAEKCMEYTHDIPLYITKKKGENEGFIDALLDV